MARLTIDDVTTPVSRDQVQSSIYAVLARIGVSTTAWKPGSVVRTMIVATSAILAAFSQSMAQIARSGFLELASDDWLSIVAWYVYGIERREAQFATGLLTVTNTGGGLYTFDIGDLIVRNSTTGATYRNTEAFSLTAVSSPPGNVASVSISASEAGSGSNAEPASISQLVTTFLGVTCTNANAIYGADAEIDSELRARCSETLGALSPMGPWDAYSSALRNATDPDGRNLGISRVSLLPDGFGRIDVYVATSTGIVPPADIAYAQEAVQLNAEPQAVTATVHSATGVSIGIACDVWVYNTSGLTDAQLQEVVWQAFIAFVLTQPVGGNVGATTPAPPNGAVFRDAMIAALIGARPEIFHVGLLTPAADVVLTPIEVAQAGGSSASIFIHQVPPPEAFHP